MSKVVVYVLDKIVWMLLITAITTQALQIAGIVESPKGLGEISYNQDSEFNFQMSVGNNEPRGKRQADERSPFIDSLFNIPISTLNAVNNLVQSSRPAFQRLRDYAQRRFDKSAKAAQISTTQPSVVQKRSYPVYIRGVGENKSESNF